MDWGKFVMDGLTVVQETRTGAHKFPVRINLKADGNGWIFLRPGTTRRGGKYTEIAPG
jgi:hypothetical protein